MTTQYPSAGGETGTVGAGGNFLDGLLTARRKGQRTTSTQQDAQTAGVPTSGAGTGPVVTDRRRKRGRDTVLTGSTGGSEEPNTYRPSIGGS